jgi:hypothetical protein
MQMWAGAVQFLIFAVFTANGVSNMAEYSDSSWLLGVGVFLVEVQKIMFAWVLFSEKSYYANHPTRTSYVRMASIILYTLFTVLTVYGFQDKYTRVFGTVMARKYAEAHPLPQPTHTDVSLLERRFTGVEAEHQKAIADGALSRTAEIEKRKATIADAIAKAKADDAHSYRQALVAHAREAAQHKKEADTKARTMAVVFACFLEIALVFSLFVFFTAKKKPKGLDVPTPVPVVQPTHTNKPMSITQIRKTYKVGYSRAKRMHEEQAKAISGQG